MAQLPIGSIKKFKKEIKKLGEKDLGRVNHTKNAPDSAHMVTPDSASHMVTVWTKNRIGRQYISLFEINTDVGKWRVIKIQYVQFVFQMAQVTTNM